MFNDRLYHFFTSDCSWSLFLHLGSLMIAFLKSLIAHDHFFKITNCSWSLMIADYRILYVSDHSSKMIMIAHNWAMMVITWLLIQKMGDLFNVHVFLEMVTNLKVENIINRKASLHILLQCCDLHCILFLEKFPLPSFPILNKRWCWCS